MIGTIWVRIVLTVKLMTSWELTNRKRRRNRQVSSKGQYLSRKATCSLKIILIQETNLKLKTKWTWLNCSWNQKRWEKMDSRSKVSLLARINWSNSWMSIQNTVKIVHKMTIFLQVMAKSLSTLRSLCTRERTVPAELKKWETMRKDSLKWSARSSNNKRKCTSNIMISTIQSTQKQAQNIQRYQVYHNPSLVVIEKLL
jgi:hypothetical protein